MTKYQVFLIIVFLFFFGSGGGWVLELFFRRFFSGANPERKWLNPGFLFGPCVPLYGFGTVVLFILSEFESQIFGQFGGSWWYYLVMFFGMALALICPLFTFFWGVLAALYYFLLYPPLRRLVVWFVAHPLFSFIVGICFGIFLIDFAVSLHLGTALRKRAVEFDKSVESIDLQAIQRRLQKRGGFFRFTSIKPLTERIDAFDEFLHRKPGKQANPSK